MVQRQISVAIIGYGNIGRGVYNAIANNETNNDMFVNGIITRRPGALDLPSDIPVFDATKPSCDWDKSLYADVAILCGGSKNDLPRQGPYWANFFNTVDSFDTHANIPEYFRRMDGVAKSKGNVAIISAGWDPGTFSLERVLADAFIPGSKRYTFWGKGVSQGHSDAVRQVEGVADARQYTIPVEAALSSVRGGENPELTTRQKHTRLVYVVAKPGADREKITKDIVTMPNYFADYDTTVKFITAAQMKRDHSQYPHGGFVLATGNTSPANKALIEYRCQWGSNPEATANILVACARAGYRMKQEGKTGAFTMLDIPPSYYGRRSETELLQFFM